MSPTKDKINQEALKQLRSKTATNIAEQLASIQPMSSIGQVFASQPLLEPWTKWRKTTSIWPRRSVNGKIIFGRINKRSRPDYRPIEGIQQRTRIREFATDKELFHQKLRGEE